MNRIYQVADVLLPEDNLYVQTERNLKVKKTYMRYDRLLCVGMTEGFESAELHRLVDVSWYKATTTIYKSVKSNAIIYCHIYIKNFGHVWGYCGGANGSHKQSHAFQDALDTAEIILLDPDGNAGSVGGCGASPVVSAVKALALKAEPNLKAMRVFD